MISANEAREITVLTPFPEEVSIVEEAIKASAAAGEYKTVLLFAISKQMNDLLVQNGYSVKREFIRNEYRVVVGWDNRFSAKDFYNK